MRITSLQNEHVKAAAKLRDRKGRDEQQRILIDGLREASRALEAGLTIVELYFDEPFAESKLGARLIAQAEEAGSALFECMPSVFAKLAYGDREEGVVAVAEIPDTSLANLEQRLAKVAAATNAQPPLLAVLEAVEKPGNVGAVLRSADAAGLSGLIVADGGTDLFNPNAIRASTGAIFTLPVASASTPATLAWLRQQKVQLLAAWVDAGQDYTQVDFTRPTAIILGSEAHGLSIPWHAPDIQPIRLPMCGQVDSLNVSVTAAVLFYEALRQRRAAKS